MGKAYANRKKKEERPENDFYATPSTLIEELYKTGELDSIKTVLDPCCGEKIFEKTLSKYGLEFTSRDIKYGNDFLEGCYNIKKWDAIVSNPPLSLFDAFVEKAKRVADKVIFIGKVNFLGVHSRNINGLWNNLKRVYIFDRMVDYRSSFREDGKFKCGNLVTGFFIWDNSWKENYFETRIIDVQNHVIKLR
jgi:hypothetical protein